MVPGSALGVPHCRPLGLAQHLQGHQPALGSPGETLAGAVSLGWDPERSRAVPSRAQLSQAQPS